MIFIIRLFALILVFRLNSFAQERFRLIIPDPKNQQLLNISVETTPETTQIHRKKALKLSFGPTSIAVHPDKKKLFASTNKKKNGHTPIAAVDIHQDGSIHLTASSAIDAASGYTSVDRSGQYYLAANYRTGNLSVHRIQEGGRTYKNTCSLTSPNKEAHCILPTPDNRFVYIPCVKNNNALYQYSFDAASGKLTPLDPFNARPPAMFGPRHVAYHPSLPIAYFSNEQQLGVSVYGIGDDGQLQDRQHVSTIPRRSPFKQGNRDLHASDLVISPDATQLFIALRDFNGDEDSIFTFRIEQDGKLSPIARSKVGDIPWKIDISPKGHHLIVSESGEQRVSIFKILPDGSLSASSFIDLPTRVTDMAVLSQE